METITKSSFQKKILWYTPVVECGVTTKKYLLSLLLIFGMLSLSCMATTLEDERRPRDHFCPIGLHSAMTDPVIAADGFSYQRENIVQWFRTGNLRSPMTGALLPNTDLMENLTLRTLIAEWRPPVDVDELVRQFESFKSRTQEDIAALRTELITLRTSPKVDTKLEDLARESRRSCVIYFHNDSKQDLRLDSSHLDHGVWAEFRSGEAARPPQIIAKGCCVFWASKSKWSGTEGRVTYKYSSDSTETDYKRISRTESLDQEIFIHWDNPLLGSNSYDFRGNPRVKRSGASGNDAVVRFFFSE